MESVKGRVRAKTGTIAGVSALSGYAEAESGETFVFSVLVNGWKDGSPKSFEDRVGVLLAEWKEP
jgi:D-alanyl-D-alanine carboxypeptidase/D-alanyl-D-alanine-endopeptidase (penicillin-binding protein 4)